MKNSLKIGDVVNYNNGLYKVWEMTGSEVIVIPVKDKLIKGFIAQVPDMDRKPLKFSTLLAEVKVG